MIMIAEAKLSVWKMTSSKIKNLDIFKNSSAMIMIIIYIYIYIYIYKNTHNHI